MRTHKIIGIFCIIIIFCITLVHAYSFRTIMNPWTGKLDYFQSENYTGYNLSADSITVNGTLIQGYSADQVYIYLDVSTFRFNESRMNSTIVTIASRYNETSLIPTSLSQLTNDKDFINSSFANSTYISKGSLITSINLTTATYNGSLNFSTTTGYKAANLLCNATVSGSKMCNEFEITYYVQNNNITYLNNLDAWVIAGSPKYIPATVPVNDCNGWQYSGVVTYLGNYWHFNSTTGGDGRALNCGTQLKLACCS